MSMPQVAMFGYPMYLVELEGGIPALGVHVLRTEDIQYAAGVTLKTHLLDTQAQIAEIQGSLANVVAAIADMQTFLTEQFGYVPGDHEASDAWVPLYDEAEKVPSNGDPEV